MLKHLFVFLLTIVAGANYAQDRFVLKFEVGKHEVTDQHKFTIDKFLRAYDPKSIDSVIFKGYADSLGDMKANLALSEKRAREVLRYCRKVLPRRVLMKWAAVGEKRKRIDSIDRRVELILYLHAEWPDTVGIKDSVISNKEPKCYYEAHDVLRRAKTSQVKRGKLEYVEVEMSWKMEEMKHVYYMSGTGGNIVYIKVKWFNKTSGQGWWAKQRYQAYIPKAAYECAKIGFLEDAPCNPCAYNFKDSIPGPVSKRVITYLISDEFLYHNIQVKTFFFNKKKIRIRVPEQYVNLEEKYFANHSTAKANLIKWQQKRGRRNANYLQTELSLHPVGAYQKEGYEFTAISRLVSVCDWDSCGPLQYGFLCGGTKFKRSPGYIGAEAGYLRYNKMNTGFVAIGFFKEWDLAQAALLVGVDNRKNAHLLVRYQYNMISFPFFAINPFQVWRTAYPGNIGSNNYGRLYAGTELRQFRSGSNKDLLVHDVHLGFSISGQYGPFKRLYIQAGYGYDYLLNSTNLFNLTITAGLSYRLFGI